MPPTKEKKKKILSPKSLCSLEKNSWFFSGRRKRSFLGPARQSLALSFLNAAA